MNPFETLAIKLLFTVQKAPADFISGLIEALNEDLVNKEPDAQQNVNNLMDQAVSLSEPAELVGSIAMLCELSDLWHLNAQIQKQADLVQQIADVTIIDPKAPFGTRIALERIAGLANKIKSISSP
jgi:hypothetical protein